MLVRLFALILLVSCLDGCRTLSITDQSSKNQSSVQSYDFHYFDRIDVNAAVNVQIHPGSSLSRVILHGDPRDLSHIKMRAKHGKFMLVLDEKQTPMKQDYPHFGSVQVDIYIKKLRALTYKGKGQVVAQGLHASPFDLTIQNPEKTMLDGTIGLRCLTLTGPGYIEVKGINSQDLRVKIQGKPKVQLMGVANLTQLTMRGGAMFSMYWLKSRTLILRADDSSRIQLAGVVNRLDVELWDKAQFNGRYLRADHAFIKTHEHSLAEVVSVKDQHTLATDASDIHFYNLPRFRADFMAINGAVLDMRDWSLQLSQRETIYNQ